MATDRQTARYVTGGFLTNRRVRRILSLAGYDLKAGLPRKGDVMLAWGHTKAAQRAEEVARQRGTPILRVEDAFLRSLFPGRKGDAPCGLLIDAQGAYFDSRQPSELETLLATHPFDEGSLIQRAHDAAEAIRRAHLTKYAAVSTTLEPPDPGYVLVIDQTKDDASIALGGVNEASFREMLGTAQIEHPNTPILIKSHPETQQGFRAGHYGAELAEGRVFFEHRPISPWLLLEGAVAVYTVSSQMGFEAIYAGHKPVVFGQPFYAGWGLTDDRLPIDRRTRTLTRAQLFAGAMLLYPTWYDPFWDRLCPVEEVIAGLAAEARAWREDAQGYTAGGMRLWKRPHLQRFYGQHKRLKFTDTPKSEAMLHLIWGAKEPRIASDVFRVEDGFLRSKGLGAELVPPLSLVRDVTGIYYDPRSPSDLEKLIQESITLSPAQIARTERLIERINEAGLNKYNLGGADVPTLPADREIVLVPGQVADDASVTLGCGEINTNEGLLRRARVAHPDAYLIYKPHPDVLAGLRDGDVVADEADLILTDVDIAALLPRISRVVTLTSLVGFEALLRGVPVTTLGAPFYAGWGLTRDLGPIPKRRNLRPSLPQLAHATLIDYPRYLDPVTKMPCPPEVIVERLIEQNIPSAGAANRTLSKLQGLFASSSSLWR